MVTMQVTYDRSESAAVLSSPGTRGMLGRYLLPSGAWERLRVLLRLSPREMQILQYVFDDRKADYIAFELTLSPHTVNTYFQRLYKKLEVTSRPQLILRVMAEYLTFVMREVGG